MQCLARTVKPLSKPRQATNLRDNPRYDQFMRFSDQMPLHFQDALPDRSAVVVIGAGIIGMATAWFLARHGIEALVLDKGRVAGEQSSRNWGWVRQTGRDDAEYPIMMESIKHWDGLAHALGEDVGFQRGGVLFLAANETEAEAFDPILARSRQHGVDTERLSQAALEQLLDGRPGQWHSALYTASDGRAEPWLAVPALARGAQRLGVKIRERCAVRGLERSAGRVSGVITEQGRIGCDTVVCASGVWSSLLLRQEGIDLPQLAVKNTVARTTPGPAVFSGAATGDDIAIRRRADGGYTLALCDELEHFIGRDSLRFMAPFLPALRKSRAHMQLRWKDLGERLRTPRWQLDQVSPFERNRVWNPEPSQASLQRMTRLLADRYPRLAGLKLADSWAGMIDATPDAVPVMDRAAAVPGLLVATGFSGHGFGIGLGAGRIVADLVRGAAPGHDLHRFRLSRFKDGSRLELGPWI